jgi:hypothetical protein
MAIARGAEGQDLNFSRVQDLTIWYNQSLKTDKMNSLKLDFRNVEYGGQIAYNSVSAMFDMPLLSKEAKDKNNSGYFSLSAAASSDKSNQGILTTTLGMLGLSYAVPISTNETYIAAGFQVGYYQSRLNVTGVEGAFGDEFNGYGPIENGISNDRLANGWDYGHFNVNAGASIFNNSKNNKWYLGASLIQLNKPYTDELKTDSLRLKMGIGIQGGYRYITSTDDEVGIYMIMNWQGGAYRHYFNLTYLKYLADVQGGAAVGVGLGYRYDDALVPDVELRYQKFIFALSYDINISSIAAAGIKRNGLELSMRIDF